MRSSMGIGDRERSDKQDFRGKPYHPDSETCLRVAGHVVVTTQAGHGRNTCTRPAWIVEASFTTNESFTRIVIALCSCGGA